MGTFSRRQTIQCSILAKNKNYEKLIHHSSLYPTNVCDGNSLEPRAKDQDLLQSIQLFNVMFALSMCTTICCHVNINVCRHIGIRDYDNLNSEILIYFAVSNIEHTHTHKIITESADQCVERFSVVSHTITRDV